MKTVLKLCKIPKYYEHYSRSDGKKCNSKWKWNKNEDQSECKKPLQQYVCKENYILISIICACEHNELYDEKNIEINFAF